MSHTDKISPEDLNIISKQIKAFIEAVSKRKPFAVPGQKLSLGETFSYWALDASAVAYCQRTGCDLLDVARDTERWHHQIKFDGKSQAFARSIVPSGKYQKSARSKVPSRNYQKTSIAEVSRSAVASRIEEAIAWIDKHVENDPEVRNLLGNDPLVRLLAVPSYSVNAFWLINEAARKSYVCVFNAPAQFSNLVRDQLIGSRTFAAVLAESRPFISVQAD